MSSTAQTLDIQIKEEDLPVLSAIATKAMSLIDRSEASAKQLEDLIKLDPGLASRILRLANSPVYGGKVKISSIGQAIVRLGMRNLKNAIVVAATGEVFDRNDPYARTFWKHGVAVGLASHYLSTKLKIGNPEECFVAGLLHDIGKVIIYRQAMQFYGALIDDAALQSSRFYKHEKTRLPYCSHETVGALVGRKWYLNPETVEVIRFHHDIEENEDAVYGESQKIVALVSLANLLANKSGFGAEAPSTIDPATSTPARMLGLEAEQLEAFSTEISAHITEQEAAFA